MAALRIISNHTRAAAIIIDYHQSAAASIRTCLIFTMVNFTPVSALPITVWKGRRKPAHKIKILY